MACASGRHVCAQGRQDAVQAASIAQLSPKAVGRITAHSRIAWSVPRGGWGEGWAGGRCLLFIMLNFCKINCICKSNTELLDYANPTAESSVERVGHVQLKRTGNVARAADLSHSVRCVRYWQKSRFLKAIDRLFLVPSCNNISGFGSLKSCVSVCHLCTGPMSTTLALVTPAPLVFWSS